MSNALKKTLSILIVMILLFFAEAHVFGAQVEKPDVTAGGAIVYCQNTGEVVYSKNMNKKIAPYSVTKLMTVLLAVQNLPLDKEVTISHTAASQKEASMNLKAGEVLTVKDLIYGALLPSGNDAAYALGEAVSGNMKDFVKLMNKTAVNIGCENTQFKNPNGMKQKGHYTSAYDMMLITKTALSNDVIRKAAGSTSYTVKKTNKSKERNLKTHLSFLKDKDSGVYGGKTGYWDANNCSIALGYQNDGLELFIVVLGDTAEERTNDVEKLIRYACAKVEGVKVIGKDKEKGKVRIKHGEKTSVEAYTAETGYAYLPKEASKSLVATQTVMRSDIEAPVKSGTVAGKLEIYVGDELVNEVDLIIKEDIETGWFTSYLGISNLAAVLIGIFIVVAAVAYVWISAARARARRRKRRLRQQKVMEIALEEMRREQEHKERDWRF